MSESDHATSKGRSSLEGTRPQPLPVALESAISHTELERTASTATENFPDGGLTAWTVLVGSFFCLFSTFGLGNSIGALQAYYVNHALSDYSSSTISWVISFQLWLLNFLPIFWGFAFDKYGPKWLLWGGMVVYVFGIMMISLSSEYWHFFLAQGVVCPIGGSAANTACMSSLVTWFYRKRGLVFGIMMGGSSVGGIVLPIMLPKLIDKVGFPWAIRAMGLVFFVALLIACCTVKSRLPPQTKPVDFMAYLRGVREPAMMSTVFGLFLMFWGLFLPYTFIILQAQSLGMDEGLTIYLLPIMHSVGLVGRVIPGVVADRFGRFNVMIFIGIFTGVACLSVWAPIRNNAGVLAFTAIFGLCSSGLTSIGPTLIAQISDIREIGARTGTAFAFQSFGLLTGSPIASAIVDARGGDYLGLQLFCGCSILASGVVFAVARHVQVGMRWKRV
jgi:MFS family permease